MKETTSQKLLTILERSAETTINLMAIMTMPKNGNRGRYLADVQGVYGPTPGERAVRDIKEYRHEYKRYHGLLYALEKQGLLAREGKERKWALTIQGLTFLKKREDRTLLKNDFVEDVGVTVISYDIPEQMRSERALLRETLGLMDFEQAHQSVWFGKKKVSRKFVEYLREHKIIDYIHIFEITKSGTLKKILDTKKETVEER